MPEVPFSSGLARERTALAWNRTAIGLLGNGILVMVRHAGAFSTPVSVVLCALCLCLVLAAAVQSFRRGRLVVTPNKEVGTCDRSVLPLGLGLVVLCLATAVAVVLVHRP